MKIQQGKPVNSKLFSTREHFYVDFTTKLSQLLEIYARPTIVYGAFDSSDKNHLF